jgi:hypothetical protein
LRSFLETAVGQRNSFLYAMMEHIMLMMIFAILFLFFFTPCAG